MSEFSKEERKPEHGELYNDGSEGYQTQALVVKEDGLYWVWGGPQLQGHYHETVSL